MKIKFYILILLLSCAGKINSQNIPNAGFENWYWLGGWVPVPNDWHCNNSQLAYPVQQDSSAYQGNFAARIIIGGNLNTGFMVTMHPVSLKFEAHSFINTNDFTIITVLLFSGGSPVDLGALTISSTIPSWTNFSIPITQNSLMADSVFISVTGGSQSGTYLVIDDMSLDYTTGVITGLNQSENLTIFPNPVFSTGQISMEIPSDEIFNLALFDISGRSIRNEWIIRKKTLDLSEWQIESGTYFLILKNENKIQASKLIIK